MTLCTKTSEVKFVRKGKPGNDGQKGDKGAKLRITDWAVGQQCLEGKEGEEWYDVKVYSSKLYLCAKSHTSSTENNPQTSVANNLGYWIMATDWQFVATKLLLAEKINADQIDATGLTATKVDISGKITADEGEIGGFTIGTSSLSCSNKSASIDIEHSGGRFLHINSGQHLGMIDVRSDDTMHAIRIQSYGDKNALDIVSNAGDGYAIRSYGDVLLEARSDEKIIVRGLYLNERDIKGTGNVLSNDDIISFRNSSAIEVTLPAARGCTGKVLFLKRKSTGTVKLIGNIISPNSISSVESYQLGYETVVLFCDGISWTLGYCG